ncbi:MAG: monovalent cation/H(+) antiporter subunit G [Deltaproteobacteria bacterium]|nr:monovalent cation/H(+) antiporter subunit G [Deltaproteobacteria bacterium]
MNTVVILLVGTGLLFFTGGGVGILRFPDFYTRLHPAGKLDTLGSLLMMLAIALFSLQPFTWAALLTSLKIMLIVVFIFLSSPTATHSIVDAGLRAGLEPWSRGDSRRTP